MCRDLGCIVIGWAALTDYGKFKSRNAVLKALEQKYGRGEKGAGKGTARTIWWFGHVIKPLDVVVANKGFSEVEGIGVVRSEYLAPGSAKNPSVNEDLPHARLVDWVIKRPVSLNHDRFFAEPTVWPLASIECEVIKRAYVKKYPDLRGKLANLFHGVEPYVEIDQPRKAKQYAGESDIEGLRSEYRMTRVGRSRRLRNKALERAAGTCSVCRRNFRQLLGGNGERCLQVHHCKQLSARRAPSVTKVSELAVVCANCHLLLHLDTHRAMSVGQLRNLLKNDGYLV
jgi:hypothetical protein